MKFNPRLVGLSSMGGVLTLVPLMPVEAQPPPPSIDAATLNRECGKGDRHAMIQCYWLGVRYTYGRDGVAKDLQKAQDLFARACDGNIAEACNGFAYVAAANDYYVRASYSKKACLLGYEDACKPWGTYAYEVGTGEYRRLLMTLISGDPLIKTVDQAENLRASAIGNLTAAAQNDPALAPKANEMIAKLRALQINAK